MEAEIASLDAGSRRSCPMFETLKQRKRSNRPATRIKPRSMRMAIYPPTPILASIAPMDSLQASEASFANPTATSLIWSSAVWSRT